MHRRFLAAHIAPVQVRAEGDSAPQITGLAAVFYRDDDPGTEFLLARYGSFSVVERLMPGCFDRAVREDDVRALINHDPNQVLGRTASQTCRLAVDARGLRYEIDPPDTSFARDLMVSLRRGDVTGSSFQFDYLERTTREQVLPDGSARYIIEVRDCKVYDVSPVTFPAYASTTAAVRDQEAGLPADIAAELETLLLRRGGARGKLLLARLAQLGL